MQEINSREGIYYDKPGVISPLTCRFARREELGVVQVHVPVLGEVRMRQLPAQPVKRPRVPVAVLAELDDNVGRPGRRHSPEGQWGHVRPDLEERSRDTHCIYNL